MKQLTITASKRDQSGSASSGRIRAQKQVPAVAYGKSKTPENLTVDSAELRVLLKKIGDTTPLVRLAVDKGEPRLSLIKEVQRHPITDKYVHVDFLEIAEGVEMDLSIPVHTIGEAFGVKNENGVLEIVHHTVEVRCLPRHVPEYIEVDVSALRVGDLIHVSDLPKLEGVEYLDDADQAVVSVSSSVEEIVAAPAADAAAPAAGAAAPAKAAAK